MKESYDSEGKFIGKHSATDGGIRVPIVNGNGYSSKVDMAKLIQIIAQVLILPLLWFIYQMYLDVGSLKVQMARLEGRIEFHQASSVQAEQAEHQRQNFIDEIHKLRQEIDAIKSDPNYYNEKYPWRNKK